MQSRFWRHFVLGLLTPAAVGVLLAGGLYVAEMIAYPRQTPIPPSSANLVAGAQLYTEHCAFCHGLPGRPRSVAAQGEFPAPPQFFVHTDRLATGLLFFRIHKGLRLTSMPGFGSSLSDNQIWQLALLIRHARQLPAPAVAALSAAPATAAPLAPVSN